MAVFSKDQPIQHVFVLMLENHSFDHLLGFSGIEGTDAETKQPTKINGLTGDDSNSFNGITYKVQQPTEWDMPVDPGHEFLDTLKQLCGPGVPYVKGQPYPAINNSGFVADYVHSETPGEGDAPDNFGEIMKCFSPTQLPVLNALAKEFAVCDKWFSSMPGPTWPNRFFLHTTSSGGLDHSPTTEEIAEWETVAGVRFANGSIFDRLSKYDNSWRIYRGDKFVSDGFPGVAALKGIHIWDAHPISDFKSDLEGDYPWLYTFIEPSYGNILNNSYKGGTSQHPMDGIAGGEQLIKETYEAIRNSALWEQSLLIVLYDEHGGFYDHAAPQQATTPGDKIINPPSINKYGFDFTQYGIRVPAVIVSPFIPKNIIDHRLYDHASVPATIEQLFDLEPMTKRDAGANHLLPLLSLTQPRNDTPTTLPDPAALGIAAAAIVPADTGQGSMAPANKGSLPGFLHAALRSELKISPNENRPAILKRFKRIKTQADAKKYMEEVQQKVLLYKSKNP